MIYITGDCHRDFRRFRTGIFTEQKEMTKDDYMIICGDFGGVWSYQQESKEEKYILDELDARRFTTLFVDGNHENFDRLEQYPVEEWHGGKVHRIRPSVLHLMRGQVYEMWGKKIFTFGGARSHDIQGGILEPDAPDLKAKEKELRNSGLCYRINHVSWWEQEMPNAQEMEEGLMNLAKHDYKVDYIISHCCATSTMILLGGAGLYEADELSRYFEELRIKVDYKRWFFGHYHDNRAVNDKDILLYDTMIRIG